MEVFSKNTLYGINRNEKKTPLVTMNPSRLTQFFSSHLHDICANFEENHFPITLLGCLSTLSTHPHDEALSFSLCDWEGEGEISLEVTKGMIEEAGVHLGDYVKILGVLRARLLGNVVVPRFEVIGISPYEDEETVPQISEARDTALLSILRDYQPIRYIFPEKTTISLLLVALEVSQIQQEKFIHALGGVWHHRDLHILSFSLKNIKEWRQSLQDIKEDIIVFLISEAAISALEDPEFLFPLATLKVHRVLILERSEGADVTDGKGAVASYLVDRVFFRSSEAGEYLRQETGRIWQKNEEERARKEELDALRESLAGFTLQPHASFGRVRFMLVGIILGFLLFIVMNLVRSI